MTADLLRRGFDGVYVGDGAMLDFRLLLESIASWHVVVDHASQGPEAA